MNEAILNKPVSELTTEELDQLLKERALKAKAEKERKERAYQNRKNELVRELVHNAEEIRTLLKEFKDQAFDKLKDHYGVMKEFGDVKSNNKGNFQLKSDDGAYKVEFSNQVIKEFDERAEMAAHHLEDFLLTHVKKKDTAMYEYIKGVTEKKNDKFDINLVGRLFKMEDKFDHPSWIKAIELFKASYVEVDSAQYVRFFKRNDQSGKYENINLNFASV
ncbi:DUF3164 family protein [Cecembia rubra]|uniref:Uncharacterized protein DUF3164 n=1 Tax=Cecembia rubra TaxID=1485585 RepID=A0A2P8EAT6_9BACT|nr:DUF3164 family protein [Cecembia rubra]PSL06565.1 uncharacterized protein DUF3164 [Cecembia rubra]